MNLEWFSDTYWVWRLPSGQVGPSDAFGILRTPDETTVVTTASSAPSGARVSGPWVLFRIADELPHDAVGIMAKLSAVLAEAETPILPFGSYDTDYVLVPSEKVDRAKRALAAAGYVHQ